MAVKEEMRKGISSSADTKTMPPNQPATFLIILLNMCTHAHIFTAMHRHKNRASLNDRVCLTLLHPCMWKPEVCVRNYHSITSLPYFLDRVFQSLGRWQILVNLLASQPLCFSIVGIVGTHCLVLLLVGTGEPNSSPHDSGWLPKYFTSWTISSIHVSLTFP